MSNFNNRPNFNKPNGSRPGGNRFGGNRAGGGAFSKRNFNNRQGVRNATNPTQDAENEQKLKNQEQGLIIEASVIKMDGTILEVQPGGICKVAVDYGADGQKVENEAERPVITAYLKGIFKERKIKVFPQDRVQVEFSIHDLTKGRIIKKYFAGTRPNTLSKSHSHRKQYVKRH